MIDKYLFQTPGESIWTDLSALKSEIRARLEAYQKLLHRVGKSHIVATRNGFERLNSISDQGLLQTIYRMLDPAIEICEEIASEHSWDSDKFQESRFIKYFCQLSNLKFRGSIYELIGDNDIVEIYDQTGIQVYRSMSFF